MASAAPASIRLDWDSMLNAMLVSIATFAGLKEYHGLLHNASYAYLIDRKQYCRSIVHFVSITNVSDEAYPEETFGEAGNSSIRQACSWRIWSAGLCGVPTVRSSKVACNDSISTLRLDAAGSYFENVER
jgi:hypothetical protein